METLERFPSLDFLSSVNIIMKVAARGSLSRAGLRAVCFIVWPWTSPMSTLDLSFPHGGVCDVL